MNIEEQPINNITWVDINKLHSNDYNPNVVLNKEMRLLKLSILKQGWIQPILVTQNYEIIDGFHRSTLAKGSKEIRAMTNGKVPCVILNLSEPERMLLTIRINRAKGNHVAFKMQDIIKTLVNDYGIPREEIARQIGADITEINVLYYDDVFKKYQLNEESLYNQAWEPYKQSERKMMKDGKL